MMKVLIDTNVVIDYLTDHVDFAEAAEMVFDLCEQNELVGILTANTITDIYYIMRKLIGREKTIQNLKLLFSVFETSDIGKSDLLRAIDLEMKDFEDALIAACAKRIKADYILTRNTRDFANSPIHGITPKDFLMLFKGKCDMETSPT